MPLVDAFTPPTQPQALTSARAGRAAPEVTPQERDSSRRLGVRRSEQDSLSKLRLLQNFCHYVKSVTCVTQ